MNKKDRIDDTAVTRRSFCVTAGMAALAATSPPIFDATGRLGKQQCMAAIDVDMEAIAAPILERYNRERNPEDTWCYFAEYLEPDTFIVNARGTCLTKEAFDRRDDIVCHLANEIEDAANQAAGIDPCDDDAWSCCEQCYWDEDGEEIGSPDDVDINDVPLWTMIYSAQWMVCCHY